MAGKTDALFTETTQGLEMFAEKFARYGHLAARDCLSTRLKQNEYDRYQFRGNERGRSSSASNIETCPNAGITGKIT